MQKRFWSYPIPIQETLTGSRKKSGWQSEETAIRFFRGSHIPWNFRNCSGRWKKRWRQNTVPACCLWMLSLRTMILFLPVLPTGAELSRLHFIPGCITAFVSHCGGTQGDIQKDISRLCPKSEVRETPYVLDSTLDDGRTFPDLLARWLEKNQIPHKKKGKENDDKRLV